MRIAVFAASLASCLPDPGDPGEGGASTAATTGPVSTSTPVPTSGGAGDTTTSSGTTGEPPLCGDGVIGGDEECDDGAANADDAACTSECRVAFCGDGKVWTVGGTEECDDGDGDAPGPCVKALCVRPMLAFRSAGLFTAPTLGGGVGGLAGADEACQLEAEAGGYPGRYKAWLSTTLSSPRRRFVGRAGVGYALLHQPRTVAFSLDGLFAGEGLFGIDEDAQGQVYSDPLGTAWTATGPDGLRAVDEGTCSDWTIADGFVVHGRVIAQSAPDWTAWQPEDFPSASCSERLPIYCFRQGEDCVDRALVAGRAACEDVGLAPDCFEDSIDFSGPQGGCEDMLTACDFAGAPCPVARELCAEIATTCT